MDPDTRKGLKAFLLMLFIAGASYAIADAISYLQTEWYGTPAHVEGPEVEHPAQWRFNEGTARPATRSSLPNQGTSRIWRMSS
jgi:hypothetical protein